MIDLSSGGGREGAFAIRVTIDDFPIPGAGNGLDERAQLFNALQQYRHILVRQGRRRRFVGRR